MLPNLQCSFITFCLEWRPSTDLCRHSQGQVNNATKAANHYNKNKIRYPSPIKWFGFILDRRAKNIYIILIVTGLSKSKA